MPLQSLHKLAQDANLRRQCSQKMSCGGHALKIPEVHGCSSRNLHSTMQHSWKWTQHATPHTRQTLGIHPPPLARARANKNCHSHTGNDNSGNTGSCHKWYIIKSPRNIYNMISSYIKFEKCLICGFISRKQDHKNTFRAWGGAPQ